MPDPDDPGAATPAPAPAVGAGRRPLPLEFVLRRRGTDAEVRVVRLDSSQVFLSLRPRPVQGVPVETTEVQERSGMVHVLRVRGVLLRLSPEEHATLRAIDGRTTVSELAFAWFLQFGSLDVVRVVGLIQQARRVGLIEWHPVGFLASRAQTPSRLDGLLNRWREWEYRVPDVGPQLARAFAPMRAFFHPSVDVLWAGFGLAGLLAWGGYRPPHAAFPLVAYPAVAAVFSVLLLFPHELGHAFACLASGREVRAVGLSAQWLVPLPYVDTTDMFRSTRAEHARVAVAGPVANLVIGAIAVAGALLLTRLHAWPGLLWLVADVSFFLAIFNFWPFLFPGDGYNALCDLLGVPRLRQKARDMMLALLGGPPAALLPGEAWRCTIYLVGVILSFVVSILAVWGAVFGW